ncbi:MAG: Uma2 family endonuclease [Polyangiaceae bacterium]|nr:Uma2 family endonuclease [Polyangiaceae bacterium]
MNADAARRRAGYADVLAAPEHVVAEVVFGVLYQSPRPALPHAAATAAIGEELGPPFKRGRGGPGGWMILDEPDLGGWRRERLPELPDAPYLELASDWACEVSSPSTRRLDRGPKRDVYAAHGVGWLWLVEPLEQFIEVLALDGGTYRVVMTVAGGGLERVPPFDAIELPLAALWQR